MNTTTKDTILCLTCKHVILVRQLKNDGKNEDVFCTKQHRSVKNVISCAKYKTKGK